MGLGTSSQLEKLEEMQTFIRTCIHLRAIKLSKLLFCSYEIELKFLDAIELLYIDMSMHCLTYVTLPAGPSTYCDKIFNCSHSYKDGHTSHHPHVT